MYQYSMYGNQAIEFISFDQIHATLLGIITVGLFTTGKIETS